MRTRIGARIGVELNRIIVNINNGESLSFSPHFPRLVSAASPREFSDLIEPAQNKGRE